MQALIKRRLGAAFPWPTVNELLSLKRTQRFNIGRRLRITGALARARFYGAPLNDLLNTCPNSVELFRQCPNLFRAVIDNYVDRRLGTLARVRIIEYELRHILRFLRAAGVSSFSADQSVPLWHEPTSGWFVTLRLNTTTPHEGLWIVTLKNPDGITAYALSLAYLPEAVMIGAVQGPAGEHAMDLVRSATKALHGIRPHFFLVEVLRALCRKSGMTNLVGIDPQYQLKPSSLLKRPGAIKFDYAAFWAELGGAMGTDHKWRIPLQGARKPLEEVESKKRAMYRRRYELLDGLEKDIRLVLSVPLSL
jgi:uncharacterized protein VirK/YbjX